MQDNSYSQNNFDQCIKCTICTAYCPVVQVNPLFPGPKQAGPDGERWRLRSEVFFDSNLKYCSNCKRCETACPSGVRIADIILAARKKYGNERKTFSTRVMADTYLAGSLVRPAATLVNKALKSSCVKNMLEKTMDIDSRRTFPEYASRTFEQWYRGEAAARQGSFKHQVSYFHGCYVNWNDPQLGRDFVAVMNALGVGVRLLDKEKCCGMPMISEGFFGRAEANARANIASISKAVSQGMAVLTTSSTCAFTLRDEYPSVLDVDNSPVRDSIGFALGYIYSLIDEGRASLVFRKDWKARAAYHVPCHMEKLGWSIFTKEVLALIPGLELVTLDSACCGLAGNYGYKKENYEASQAIGRHLFNQIKSEAPDFVISECESCKSQIEMSTGFQVLNPVTVLASALDLEATFELNNRQ